jgi:hypothetical protein
MAYQPTAETIEAYTEGDCWHLALSIHRITGKPLVFANPMPRDPDYWEHVGVQISKTRILDVTGVHTNMKWRKRWAGEFGVLYRTTDKDYIKVLMMDQERIYSNKTYRVARRLVETYAEHLLVNNI